MATFDINKAAAILTQPGGGVLDALAVKYGVPNCLLEMTEEVLGVLPTNILGNFNTELQAGRAKADETLKDIMRELRLDTGIVEYDTNLGRFVFVSNTSNKGIEANSVQFLEDLDGFGNVVGFAAGAAIISQNLMGQYQEAVACVDTYKAYLALQKGPSALAHAYTANIPNANPIFPSTAASIVYEQHRAAMEDAANFRVLCDEKIRVISDIMLARLEDPLNNPEPCFDATVVDPQTGLSLSAAVPGTTLCIINPVLQQQQQHALSAVEIISAENLQPPLSIQGQFLFSKTGIYYDSYGGGLQLPSGCITNIVSAVYFTSAGDPIPGGGVPPNSLKWLLESNPNIGGKGTCVTLHDYTQWANTVFDLEVINESPSMQIYYEQDHFLQVLVDQRNKEVQDVSGYVTDLITSGYSADSAQVINQKQVLYSKVATHNNKIKRRKKQIEVHVVLSPIQPSPGEIPLNDFTSLDSAKLTVERSKQENLVFRPNEVSGIVLPLCPNYIKSELAPEEFGIEELMVPEVGVGGIITSDPRVSGTSGTVLSLNDQITTKGLVGVYNLLDTDLVVPSSLDYLTTNCATESASAAAAQLVASSIPSMFISGVGIPYFRGVCTLFGKGLDYNLKSQTPPSVRYSEEQLYAPYRPYGYGVLEGDRDALDSLLYKQSGFTFESWVHVPDLGDESSAGWSSDNSVSSLHRVILGCENRGGTFSSTDANWIVGPRFGTDVVRGLLIGFSRDRRITKGQPPKNVPSDNALTKGLVFHMSPTQSINTSGVTFLAASADPSYCEEEQAPLQGFYGISVDTSTSVSGVKIGDVSSGFKLITVSVDYGANKVSVYLDGIQMKSQSIQETFGRGGPPNLPSPADASSYSYTNTFASSIPTFVPPILPVGSLGQQDFWVWDGPRPNPTTWLTPWVVGGGYTDGMTAVGLRNYTPGNAVGMNFMGGEWGGKKSGLHGFLGSVKLYNRALVESEVITNFKAQRGFFTNIRTYVY